MLNSNSVDVRRLRHDLRSSAVEARALKTLLGQTWTRPMAAEQRLLSELKKRVTRLCILRAFLRGKLHLQKAPKVGRNPDEAWEPHVYHARIAERTAREYLLESEERDARAV